MPKLTEADIHCDQIWRDAGTPHRWGIQSVVRDHIVGDVYETTVTLISEFDGRDTLRIPGTVLLRDYELEPPKPVDPPGSKVARSIADQIEGSIIAQRLQGASSMSLLASYQTWAIVVAALRSPSPLPTQSNTGGHREGPAR